MVGSVRKKVTLASAKTRQGSKTILERVEVFSKVIYPERGRCKSGRGWVENDEKRLPSIFVEGPYLPAREALCCAVSGGRFMNGGSRGKGGHTERGVKIFPGDTGYLRKSSTPSKGISRFQGKGTAECQKGESEERD